MTTNDGNARFSGRGSGPERANSGIYVGGNNYGPVAHGYQSHAEQVNYGSFNNDQGRLEQALKDLEDGIRQMGGARADDALEDIDRVREEMGRGKPDRGRIAQLVERVAAVVAPVSALAELADHVITLIPH